MNLMVLLGVIAVNALANILPINGVTTGEVSAQYDNYFTPAGFTFSIWSLIYLGLLIFTIYQFISKSYNPKSIGYYFVFNGLANMSWILAWHYGYFLMTVLIIMILLGTLIVINIRIQNSSYFVKFPFRTYLGWICVATIANTAVYLEYLEISILGINELYWAMILVITGGAIGLFLLFKKGWFAAAMAIAWGIWGIYRKQIQEGQSETYQILCLGVVITIIAASLFTLLQTRFIQKRAI